jgi:hypothetical protein
MKKFTVKEFVFCLILLPFLLLAFGCSKASDARGAYTVTNYQMERALAYDGSGDVDRLEYKGSSTGSATEEYIPYVKPTAVLEMPDAERKLAKRASFSIRVENLDEADASVTGLMEKYGAYSAMSQIYEDSRHYSIRVPSTAYDVFIAGTAGLGRILQRNESAEDVTLRYYDLEGRLATKKELLKTYQSYLGRARNIEEILSVEARIADLQNDLEGTGRELRNLANRVDYAVVDLNIQGPVASSPYRSGPTAGERFKELFSGFGSFLSVLAVILSGIVIYGAPILLILVLLFWLLFGRIGLLKKLFGMAAGKTSEK